MAEITVTGIIKDPYGASNFPVSGKLRFKLDRPITNSTGKTVAASTTEVTINALTGAFTVSLESTTDAVPNTALYTATLIGVLGGRYEEMILGVIQLLPTPSSQILSDRLDAALATPSIIGADSNNITFLQTGTGAIERTVQDKERDTISVFDFMTPAQIADVRAGTLLVDVTAAINVAWVMLMASPTGGRLIFPPGRYKTTSNLVFNVSSALVPFGCEIIGTSGSTFIHPTAAVTTAITLTTESNLDGTTNSLLMSGFYIEGILTTGATGILVGNNATSGFISIEHTKIVRFAGANSRGLHIRNNVVFMGRNIYAGRNGTGAYIEGSTGDLPTMTKFYSCHFRESKSDSGGSGRGVDLVHGYQTVFHNCLFESNQAEGFYCVPIAGQNAIFTLIDGGSWFEANWNGDAGAATKYNLKADGTLAGTVMITVRDTYFQVPTRAIYLKTAVNSFLDNIFPGTNSADQFVIDINCRGGILNWPENNAAYATVVNNSSPVTFSSLGSYWQNLVYVDPATGDLLPTVTESYSFGSAVKKFQDMFLSGQLTAGSLVVGSVSSFADALVGSPSIILKPNTAGNGELRNIANATMLLWEGTGNRIYLSTRFELGSGVATAANDLTLPMTGNTFVVSGNTQINAIIIASWIAGSQITLVFTGTPTIKHNTAGGAGTEPMKLQGSADLVAANDVVLDLVRVGGYWQERGRKTP